MIPITSCSATISISLPLQLEALRSNDPSSLTLSWSHLALTCGRRSKQACYGWYIGTCLSYISLSFKQRRTYRPTVFRSSLYMSHSNTMRTSCVHSPQTSLRVSVQSSRPQRSTLTSLIHAHVFDACGACAKVNWGATQGTWGGPQSFIMSGPFVTPYSVPSILRRRAVRHSSLQSIHLRQNQPSSSFI